MPKQFIEQVAQNITAHVAIAPDEMHSLKLKARDSSKDMSIDATLPIASDATAFVRAWYEFGVWPELDPDSPPLLVYGASTSRVPGPAGWTFVDSQRQALKDEALDVSARTDTVACKSRQADVTPLLVSVLHRGSPLANAKVDILDSDGKNILATGVTRQDGSTNFDVPSSVKFVFVRSSIDEKRSGRDASGKEYRHVAHYGIGLEQVFECPYVPDMPSAAAVARWLVHKSNFAGVATTSIHLKGEPYVSAMSFSDGDPKGNGTGRMFFFMSPMDATCADLLENGTISIALNEAGIGPMHAARCAKPPLDEEDPNCVKLSIVGEIGKVGKADEKIATDALFSRFQDMAKWPTGHGWLLLELKPKAILLLDEYGGAKHISASDFYKADPQCPPHGKMPPPMPPATGRPPWLERAKVARWLVHSSRWGTLATKSLHFLGSPYGSTISFSDGDGDQASGRIFMYLTKMDPAAQDIAASSVASFALTEMPLGVCNKVCAEDPTCARIILTGSVKVVTGSDIDMARKFLFSKHPAMAKWPAEHGFRVYELQIQEIFFLDMYGGAKPLTVEEYFSVEI